MTDDWQVWFEVWREQQASAMLRVILPYVMTPAWADSEDWEYGEVARY